MKKLLTLIFVGFVAFILGYWQHAADMWDHARKNLKKKEFKKFEKLIEKSF